MFGFLRRPRRRHDLIGVDISPARVNLLQFARCQEQIHVTAYASHTLPEGALQDFEIKQPAAISQAILRARQRCGLGQRGTVLAMAGAGLMHKTIQIPAGLSGADLQAQIWLEAREHIPYPLDEISLDFQVLPATSQQAEQRQVLLVACRRERIAQLTNILQQAGLAPAIMTTQEHILHSVCRWACPADVSAIVDIGTTASRFSRCHTELPQPALHWPVGSQKLEEQSLDSTESGALSQLQQGLASGQIDPASLQSALQSLAQQIGHHLQRACQSQPLAEYEPGQPAKLGICGRITRWPGLVAALQQHLPHPVVLLNPLAGLPASQAARAQHLDAEAPGLLLASGLALRGLG